MKSKWLFVLTFVIILLSKDAFCEEKLYNAKGKRDPFTPLVASGSKAAAGGLLGVESIEEVVVEGIVCDPDPKNSVAVVNGSVLKEGDEVGVVKLVKIDPAGASLSVNGIEGYRQLYQEDTKKVSSEKNA